jgi:hypothetical protein
MSCGYTQISNPKALKTVISPYFYRGSWCLMLRALSAPTIKNIK